MFFFLLLADRLQTFRSHYGLTDHQYLLEWQLQRAVTWIMISDGLVAAAMLALETSCAKVQVKIAQLPW